MFKQMGNFNIEIKTIKKSNRNTTGGRCDIGDREESLWQAQKTQDPDKKRIIELKGS